MPSPIEQAIRDHVREYLDEPSQLHEFEDWFVPVLWRVDGSNDQAAIDLAAEIHILLAEYSRHDRSLDSLREELENAIRPFEETGSAHAVLQVSRASQTQQIAIVRNYFWSDAPISKSRQKNVSGSGAGFVRELGKIRIQPDADVVNPLAFAKSAIEPVAILAERA